MISGVTKAVLPPANEQWAKRLQRVWKFAS